jgi:CheY-like chemotaxis protein
MNDSQQGSGPGFDFSSVQMLADALHSQLLARRRATLDHDIKNVVHGLMSGTELLAKALSASSARITPAECLNLLQQQLGRVQTTLNRILDEVAPLPRPVADVDLAELVGECTYALRHQLQSLRPQSHVPAGLTVRVARTRCKDILLFVLLDCIDRAPAQSNILIAVRELRDERLVKLSVQHGEAASAGSATSIAMIAPLLAAEHARVEFASSAGERTVEVILPLAAAASTDILFVDANRDAADSLVMLVQLDGLGAEACYDISAAAAAVQSISPKAVVVDLDGSVDSRSLVRTIRSEQATSPRVIGLSHSHFESVPGVDAYLQKPLELAALRRAIG